MIPNFRAWDTHEEVMNRVDYIDFVNGVIGMSNENVRDYEQPIHRVNIMQYTGLKDKNGVEIFEGDVVFALDKLQEMPSETKGHIIYEQNDCAFEIAKGNNRISLYDTRFVEYEVIGNVYENPELLEVAE